MRAQRLSGTVRGFDAGQLAGTLWSVSDSVHTSSLSPVLRWLAAHAGFPARRLPLQAETLVLLAAAAQAETDAANSGNGRFLIKSRDVAKDSALRAHALRRSLVHFKCDNSAKV